MNKNIIDSIQNDIKKAKNRLRGRKIVENFGQKEVIALKEKYSQYKYGENAAAFALIIEFDRACEYYTGGNL